MQSRTLTILNFILGALTFVSIFFVLSRIAHRIYLCDYRRDRFKFPRKIGILSGSVQEDDIPCPIEPGGSTPQQWSQFLQEQGHGDSYTTNLIVPNEIDDDFAVIINPFGESYPEEDLARRKTFYRIKEFIKNGGLFVNTSGLAFYYSWDSNSAHRFITGEHLEGQLPDGTPYIVPGQTNVLHSWMREHFDVKTTIGEEVDLQAYQLDKDIIVAGDVTDIGGSDIVREYRAAVYGQNLIPILRSLKPAENPLEECYPLCLVKFGVGYLLLAGFKPASQGWFNKISSTFMNLSASIMKNGTLDLLLD